jgi:hypothetical protein
MKKKCSEPSHVQHKTLFAVDALFIKFSENLFITMQFLLLVYFYHFVRLVLREAKKIPFFANPEINQGIKDNRVMMKNALPCKKKKKKLLARLNEKQKKTIVCDA